jgi:membrane fusion protein (multidrug efflux system)
MPLIRWSIRTAGQFPARARLDNAAGKLRPGMFVRVRLLFGERKDVLMVPEQAIVPGGSRRCSRWSTARRHWSRSRLGVRRAAQVEVVEGLAEGDVVVTAGQFKLRDGAAVRRCGRMRRRQAAEGQAAESQRRPRLPAK